jgi:ABC-type branched-subunit amino acid transport system permease subunit
VSNSAVAGKNSAIKEYIDPFDTRGYMRVRWAIITIALIFAALFPWIFPNPAVTSIAMFTMIYLAATTGWNMFSGLSGYTALGHAVFYGSGAYFFANITTHLNLKGGVALFAWVPVAGVVAGVVALPIGWLALRTRRHVFVVITIAIFFIFQLLAYNLTFITNGSAGLQVANPPWGAATYNNYFYIAALAVAVFAIALVYFVRKSSFGLELLAIRDDEDRALGLGVKTTRVKLLTFVMSGAITGMCGAIYAYYLGSVYPPFAFEAIFDVTLALMAFLGGLGTITGPILGALIIEPTQQYLNLKFTNGGIALIVFGVVCFGNFKFFSEGFFSTAAGIMRKRFLKRIERQTIPDSVAGV